MKTKLFTVLALAAALLIGQPAFAHSDRGGGKGGGRSHAVAAVHNSGGSSVRVASVSHSRGLRGTSRVTSTASRRDFTVPLTRGYASTRSTSHMSRSRQSVAFGGNSYNARARGGGGGGNGNYTYAFASHAGWNHGSEYYWQGRHYRWFNNGWFIIDPFPYGYYGYTEYGPGYDNADTVAVQVQQDLLHDGYYQGPVDGIIGPGTRAAIAAYQRDNSLPVTGTITLSLLDSLHGA